MADMNNSGSTISSQFRGLNGRHPGQWPIIPQILCAVGVFLVVMVAGWFIGFDGQLDELDAGQQTEVKLREEYKQKVGQANNLEALREQKAQVSEYVQTLEKALPSKSEMESLLHDITQAGIGHGLQFDSFTPGQAVAKDYYAEQPIEIKVNGSYHDIGLFSSEIANLPRIVTLNNLSVNSKDGTLNLSTTAKTFRYLDSEEVAQQRGPAKGAKKK